MIWHERFFSGWSPVSEYMSYDDIFGRQCTCCIYYYIYCTIIMPLIEFMDGHDLADQVHHEFRPIHSLKTDV